MIKMKFTHIADDVKTDFANWLDRLPKESSQDKSWSERYEELFRKSNGNNNYLVGQNKDRNWLMRRKTREEVAGMIKAVEESSSTSRANRNREARAGAELVAQSGRWSVYRIKTPEASAHYGAHTRWCIAGNGIQQSSSIREDVSYARSYWRSQTRGYSKVFYYIRNDDNKFALLWESPSKFQLWDALDNRIMQASYGDITFEAGAINEVKMFCYTVPKNPQTDNFDFKEMFNDIISRGNEALRSSLQSYNREAADGQFVDFTDEDFNDPNFNQLVCDTIPTTSNIDILLSRMRRTNAPLIKMKITCNTTNAIRDSLKTNNKIDLYNGGFKLKSENKSFRAVKDRFKKLAEMNADPNSGLKILSIGYLVSFAPALKFIPYTGNDNAQFIIEDQNQINTLLNNFSRYEDHALYDLFSVGINDVLTNSLRYINNYFNSHQDMSTNDYNKMLGKLNEYLQYYIRMSVKANRSQLGFALPTASINVIDEAALNKIIESFELSTDQSNDLHTILSDATNTARISRDVQRNVQSIENDTNVDQVEVNQAGGLNTAELEQQLSIDDLEENQDQTIPEQTENIQRNRVQENTETVEETEEDDSDTWPNGVPKVILGKEISSSEASSLGPLTPEQREGVVLFDIVAARENKEITQEEYDKIKNGNAALGNSLEHLHDKMQEYGITLVEDVANNTNESNELSEEDYSRLDEEVRSVIGRQSRVYGYSFENGDDDFAQEYILRYIDDADYDHDLYVTIEHNGNVLIGIDNGDEIETVREIPYGADIESSLTDAFEYYFVERGMEETDQEIANDEYIRNVMTEIKNALDSLSSSYSFGYNVDFDDKFYDVEFDHDSSGFRIQVKEDGNIKILRDTDGRGNLTQIYEYNTRDTSCQEIISEVFSNLADEDETEEHNESTESAEYDSNNFDSYIDEIKNNVAPKCVQYNLYFLVDSGIDSVDFNIYGDSTGSTLLYLIKVFEDSGLIRVYNEEGDSIYEYPYGTNTVENIISEIFSNLFNETERQDYNSNEAQENPQPQNTQQNVPQEKYKFLIYGLDMNGQYKILDVTPNEEFIVNNATDDINACNANASQVATDAYEQLKSTDFEDLGLREVHYMKVINVNGNKLVKIIR